MRHSLFWNVTGYWHYGTNCRCRLQWSSSWNAFRWRLDPVDCTETSVTSYQPTSRSILEARRPNLQKFRIKFNYGLIFLIYKLILELLQKESHNAVYFGVGIKYVGIWLVIWIIQFNIIIKGRGKVYFGKWYRGESYLILEIKRRNKKFTTHLVRQRFKFKDGLWHGLNMEEVMGTGLHKWGIG